MLTVLLLDKPELPQPEPLGISHMPFSGIKIGKAANKASDRTSVVGIFSHVSRRASFLGKITETEYQVVQKVCRTNGQRKSFPFR